MAVTADPERAAEDLVQAILPDPAMCAAIIKFANSAFFGIPRDVATMEKAVTVLGFNEVHNIVLGKAVFNSFKKINSQNKQSINTFWRHSFSCGLTAKILAEDLGSSPSELFIAGLIHDIGKLALFVALSDKYLPILMLHQTDRILCRQQENETFGIDHPKVGYRLLTRWLFPESLLNAVGFHHDPETCSKHTKQAIIVQLSDALTILAEVQEEGDASSLLSQLLALLPENNTLWEQYEIEVNEEILHKWLAALKASFEKDSGILTILTS
jgi:HD-like signal output (HDOD) protein